MPPGCALAGLNCLRWAGTPLEGQAPASPLDMIRCIATARITMPRSVVRLSAGRLSLSITDQACRPLRPCTLECWDFASKWLTVPEVFVCGPLISMSLGQGFPYLQPSSVLADVVLSSARPCLLDA